MVQKTLSSQTKHVPVFEDKNGWWETLPQAVPFAPLRSREHTNFVVVGAGWSGLAAAEQLAKTNPDSKVIVLEADRAGYTVSGRSSGVLMAFQNRGEKHDLELTRKQMRLGQFGLDHLRKLATTHNIDCGWSEWGRLYVSAGPDGDHQMDRMLQIMDEIGEVYEHRSTERMSHDLGTPFYRKGAFLGGNGLINPAAFVQGWVRHLPENVTVYEQSPLVKLESQGKSHLLQTPEGEVTADKVLITTGIHLRHLGLAKNRYVSMATYASMSEPLSDEQLNQFKIGNEFCLFATAANGPTIRLTNDGRLCYRNVQKHCPSGAIHAEPLTDIAKRHREAINSRWPSLADLKFPFIWGGALSITPNNSAIFGEMHPGVFATACGGMTMATVGGHLLADLANGNESSLLSDMMGLPSPNKLPPRPFLDLGVKWKLRQAAQRGAQEF